MAQKGRKRKSKKWINGIIFLVLIVAAGVMCYFVWDAYFRDKTEKPGDGGSEVQVAGDDKEDKKEEIEVKSDGSTEKPKVEQYDGDDPNTLTGLTGVLTYAGVSNGYLRLRVNIDQYLSSGTCILVLSRNGNQIYSDYTNIVDSASTSTCEGFDVLASELGTGGLQIKITLASGDKNGVITGEATI